MTRFDFYKDAYDKEIDRRKAIEAGFTLPVSLITGLVAWLLYFYIHYYLKHNSTKFIKILLSFSAISLLFTIICLIISYFSIVLSKSKPYIDSAYDYNYLEKPSWYENFYKKILNRNKESVLSSTESDKCLEEYIIKDLIECTDHNISVNDRKGTWLVWTKVFLIISLLINFSMLCYGLYIGLIIEADPNSP